MIPIWRCRRNFRANEMTFERRSIGTLLSAILILCAGTGWSKEWPLLNGVMRTVEKRGLDVDRNAIETAATRTFIESVDPGAALMSDEEKRSFLRRSEGYSDCAGLMVERNAAGDVLISKTLERPIEGLAAGDTLLSVDGENVADLDIFRVYEMLKGPNQSEVGLVVSNSLSAATTVTVERVSLRMPALVGTESLPGGMLYVKLRGLFAHDIETAVDDIAAAMASNGSSGSVLDLRGAGGNAAASALKLAGLFVPAQSNLFSYVGLDGGMPERFALDSGQSQGAPLIILQDGGTVGAAELFCAICRSAGAGIVSVGSASAGDPLLRDFSRLAEGRHLYLLARQLELEDGSVYRGRRGVQPDIAVDPDAHVDWSAGTGAEPFYQRQPAEGEDVNRQLASRVGDDAALRRAVDILIGLKALGLN